MILNAYDNESSNSTSSTPLLTLKGLSKIAVSGDYNDLINTPTIVTGNLTQKQIDDINKIQGMSDKIDSHILNHPNTDISSQLNNYVLKENGKVLSDNNFTNDEKQKLKDLGNNDYTVLTNKINTITETINIVNPYDSNYKNAYEYKFTGCKDKNSLSTCCTIDIIKYKGMSITLSFNISLKYSGLINNLSGKRLGVSLLSCNTGEVNNSQYISQIDYVKNYTLDANNSIVLNGSYTFTPSNYNFIKLNWYPAELNFAGEMTEIACFNVKINNVDVEIINTGGFFVEEVCTLKNLNLITSTNETYVKSNRVRINEANVTLDSKILELQNQINSISGNFLSWNKTWLCIGDSITEINSTTTKNYHGVIKDWTNCTIINKGISGSGFSDGTTQPIKDRISSMPDADIITVFAGTCDFGLSTVPLGTISDKTSTTFAGCVDIVIQQLLSKYQNKTIAFITPMPRYYSTDLEPQYGTQASTGPKGNPLYKYVDIIKSKCYEYSIPCLNLYGGSGLYPWLTENNKLYFSNTSSPNGDGLHPNDKGHIIIANKIYDFLKPLIR